MFQFNTCHCLHIQICINILYLGNIKSLLADKKISVTLISMHFYCLITFYHTYFAMLFVIPILFKEDYTFWSGLTPTWSHLSTSRRRILLRKLSFKTLRKKTWVSFVKAKALLTISAKQRLISVLQGSMFYILSEIDLISYMISSTQWWIDQNHQSTAFTFI